MHNNEHDTHLKRLLEAVVQEEVTDDMDLWSDIQRKLERQRPPRLLMLRRMANIAAVLVLMLTVSAVGYAVYQSQYGGDAGLDAVNEAGLFTPIDQMQTMNNVTVTVHEAYADANRIVLAYEGVYDQADTPVPAGGFDVQWTLYDTRSGQTIPPFFGGGGGGGGDGDTLVRFGGMQNFDASVIEGTPETLDLRLELRFAAHTRMNPPMSGGGGGGGGAPQGNMPPASGGGGGGGGGGGNAQIPPVTMPALPTPVPVDAFEPFTFAFDFTLPFIEERVVMDINAQTDSDITVQLNALSITPSLTIADLCIEHPGDGRQWLPIIRLTAGDVEIRRAAFPLMPDAVNSDGFVCGQMELSVPYMPDEAVNWTLAVDYLRGDFLPTPETVATIEQALTDAGLNDVSIYSQPRNTGERVLFFGMSFKSPSDSDFLLDDVLVTVTDQITGDWVFDITLPESE